MPLTHSFAVPVELPFDWQSLLAFLRMRAAPGVENVSDSAYARTVIMGNSAGKILITRDPASAAIQVSCTGAGNGRGIMEAAVKRLFKTGVNTGGIEAFLCRDRRLGGYVARQPGLRVPGGWSGFEVAARGVLGQQISVPAATTLMGRLVRAAGTRLDENDWLFPSPAQVLAADLGSLGIPGRRRDTLKAMAALFAEQGEEYLDRPDAVDRLLAISGIGRWTAGYVLMRTSTMHDHWPEGDLVLRKALGGGRRLASPAQLADAFSRFSPYRSYATIHLWRGYVSSASAAAGRQ